MALIDKETIRKEIERRIENCVKNVNHRPCHRIEELCELLGFLDTLPEQPEVGDEYFLQIGKHAHTLRVGSTSDIERLIRRVRTFFNLI